MRDPYQVLGITKSASADDIKAAFRRLAKQLHPDLNPGRPDIELKFKELNTAYGVLSDPDQRKRFDRGEIDGAGNERSTRTYRKAYAKTGAGRDDPFGGFGGFGFGGDDPFSDLFNNKRKPNSGPQRTRGADVAYSVTVSFLEACLGAKRRVILSTGKAIDVAIPPGTEDEQRLRLKGQGLNGIGGGDAGDALIEVKVDPHPHLTRSGNDIHLEIPVSLAEAVLGATARVPTLDGPVVLKIPRGANTGTVLRLKGRGVPLGDTEQRGDQLVRLTVVLPEQPDAELTAFVERWAKSQTHDVRKKLAFD